MPAELPPTWEHVPLPEALDFREGPGIMAVDFCVTGVPLVRLAGLRGGSLLTGCNFLDPAKVETKWRQFKLAEGDTLLSTSASLGRIARVSHEAVGAIPYTGIIRFRPRDERVLEDYVAHVLTAPSFTTQIEAMGAGSVMRHFGPSHLRQMTIDLPPFDVQRAISDVLAALDDKIESNRLLADQYDATWLCHGSHALRGAETASVQELLDDGILVVNDGYRAKNSELAAEGIAFVRAGNLTDQGLDLTGADRVPADLAARVGDKQSLAWDTAFTSKGTVGRITLVDPDAQTFVYSPQVCFWRSLDDERLSPFVLHAWMRSGRFSAQIDAVKGQTDMADYVSLRDQRAMRFDLPTRTAQRTVAAFAEPLARAASAVRKESRTLSAIRDAVHPKLVSGQIRIPLSDDVEEGVGAAIEALA